MSMLAPFFLAGALAVAAPILFHLIRQHPKGAVPFSSVMFLREVPPRLTRRSRLDQWPLLLLRALALLLLAAAFARPFLRGADDQFNNTPVRRIAVLVDRSASMQREDLWEQAIQKAETVLTDLSAQDQFAVFVFDTKIERIWETSLAATSDERQNALPLQALTEVQPTWRATDLGTALREAADWAQWPTESPTAGEDGLADEEAITRGQLPGPASIVLISDLQDGSKLDALQQNTWPEQVTLDIRRVVPKEEGNATAIMMNDQTLENLQESSASNANRKLPVRVVNSKLASQFDLTLQWNDASDKQTIQVEADATQIIRLDQPADSVTAMVLSGDNSPFDNTVHWVAPEKRSYRLLHVGDVQDDPRESLFYYLERVPLDNATRTVSIQTTTVAKLPTDLDPRECPLMVVSDGTNTDAFTQSLVTYTEAGGRVLFVMDESEDAKDLITYIASVTDNDSLSAEEATVNDYAMWSRVDFSSPLFASMADPQFNDFSKIQFWTYRNVSGLEEAGWNILANFDSGAPALAQTGNVWLLTTGWQPSSSQLALSTKFIPLIAQMFTGNEGTTRYVAGHVVGTPLPWPPTEGAELVRSDGESSPYEQASDADFIDRPGVHQLKLPDEAPITFASNLSESESQTDAMDEDTLERLGIGLGEAATAEKLTQATLQLRDRELESNQRLWQWLLLAAIGMLVIETLWGGRYAKRIA
ncbi:inter-alpha-trypsin inhibitor heavy chain H2 precursor-like protein [Rhodopirellula baltica SH28]|uniref:Inter-alpha-trypsin inhibitor heavy chain H2-like protein n=1 Tax=Rhodopirellula baltica SH28 TaxID=993517 RepID=K5D7Y5_RHOBT|nr:BatA domain-containing protein [Rhodopirellula baltica]EKK02847.1 inter-alpha-trypsin inhibitor heavy chain H2 precursor-like protein [Rhodopirellula baltica SH28]